MDETISLRGQTFRTRLDGPIGAPWLVFSNSLMTDLGLWNAQIAAFSQTHRILRYDQRGHGQTSIPATDCTFDDLVADLAALMTHHNVQNATLAGVSMGGVTALGTAARHPSLVARVLICDCQPVASPANAKAWDDRIALVQSAGMAALVEPTVSRWFRPAFLTENPPALGEIRAMIANTKPEGFLRAVRALQSYDLRPELSALACPTTFLVGALDGVLPPVVRAMAEHKSARFTEIAESGHLPPVEQPEAFNAALKELINRK